MRRITTILLLLGILMAVAVVGQEEYVNEEQDSEEDNEEGPELDEEDMEEAEIMHTPFGARVRLLQLERAIYANILSGGEALAYIEDTYPDADTTRLEEILEELEILLEEVQEADLNQTAEELAEDFVSMKSDARSLSREFRQISNDILSPGDASQLRARLRQAHREQLQELREQIRNRKCQYNAERIQEMLSSMGIEDEELPERIRDCSYTASEVKERIRERVQSMAEQAKAKAVQRMQERREDLQQVKENIRERVREQREEHIEERLERQEQRLKRAMERLEKRGENAEERLERVQQRIENRTQKLQERAEKIKQRLTGIGGGR